MRIQTLLDWKNLYKLKLLSSNNIILGDRRMKKIASIIIVSCFLLSGYGVVATNGESSVSSYKASPLEDDVPIWSVGNTWTYTVNNITVRYNQGGQRILMDGTIEDFTWTVTDTTGEYYTVALTGKLSATYDILLNSQTTAVHLVGSFTPTLTRLKGTLQLTKSNLQVHAISLQLLGITMTKINSLSFSLPLPFKLVSQGSLTTDFPLFNFPLYMLKFWDLPDLTLTMSSTFGGIFGLIQIPFTVNVHYSWMPLAFFTLGKEDVTVPAGTYNAYKVQSLIGDYFVYYYASGVGNIVKIDVTLPNGALHAVLKSATYP
jgi:hypothetical protein